MTYFIDTNIILRFLTRDEEKQYQACKKLLEKAQEGKLSLTASPLVIFEVIWTLISYYNESKESVVEKITSLLELPNLLVESKEIFLESLVIWQQKNIEFNDAFNYIWTQKKGVAKIFSFDKHFNLLPQIERLEP